ncbi:hypothetical protein RhiirA4_526324 [Rhizophagus irregularis]|uniref:Uncharacterized protein n=1 Tax=Rhizophagus irregularis TaxID=588596 RepID=A0A2I1GQH9_9GLOM|nr:hypothetical protein RhiirA4_526324 [Rhizophagus irregularis]
MERGNSRVLWTSGTFCDDRYKIHATRFHSRSQEGGEWVDCEFFSFGFIRFSSRKQAAEFYYKSRGMSYHHDEESGPMRFLAAIYFNTSRKDNETNEISNNESNENTKSRKRKVIDISNNENPKSGNPKINKFPSVVYGLFEVRTGQTYIIILHTPGIADKSGLLISSVNDKVISIESYFNEKIVPGKQ